MIIVCENCTAKFNLDDSLLSQNGSRVRCSQCGHLFLAFPKGYGPEKDLSTADNAEPHPPDEDPINKPSQEEQLSMDKTSVKRETGSPEKETVSSAPMESDTSDLNTDMELDFSDDEFDFDESDLDLNLDLGDLTADDTAPPSMKEDILTQDIPDDLNLKMDTDIDDKPPLDSVEEDNIPLQDATDDFDFDDDINLELDLDTEELIADDSLDDLFKDHDLDQDTVDDPGSDDDFSLELDLDTEEVTADEPLAQDPMDDLDSDDDFSLELDLDDDEVTADEPLAQDPTDDLGSDDDFSLELDLDTEEVTADEPLAQDPMDDLGSDDDFSLEMDLDSDEVTADVPLAQDSMDDLDTDDDFSLEMDLNDQDATASLDDKDTNIDIDPPVPPSDEISTLQEGTTKDDEFNEEIPEPPATEEKDTTTESGDDIAISSTLPAEELMSQEILGDTEKKSSLIVRLFLFILFILILVLGAHAGSLLMEIPIPFISDLKIPFLTELVTPLPPPPPPVRLEPDKKTINGRFETNQKEGVLFVIAGNIRNPSKVTCTNVKVTASLLNTEKAKIKTKTVVCGATISDKQLTTLDMAAIDGLLTGPSAMKKASLAPGQSCPFMIVFSKLPDNLENFTVTVKDFDKN